MMRQLLTLVCFLCVYPAFAASSIEVFTFADEVQETRYRALIAELRCPKCLNTNLAGSDAAIAVDLRKTVYRLLVAGKTDAEIRGFLQERYGNFVLYDPPLIPSTWLLWFGPGVFVLLGGFGLYRFSKRAAINHQTEAEQAEIVALVADLSQDNNS